MEQLILDLAAPVKLDLASFLPGANQELLHQLESLSKRELNTPCLYMWGDKGAGKSHLLHATLEAAKAQGRMLSKAEPIPQCMADCLIAIDDLEQWSEEQHRQLFVLFNESTRLGSQLLVASRIPIKQLRIREDLRTRLASGLVYQLHVLPDEEKPEALLAYARAQGFRLSSEVIAYLFTHGRRDLPSLLAILRALDRYSLTHKRLITLPLLRDLLSNRPVPQAD